MEKQLQVWALKAIVHASCIKTNSLLLQLSCITDIDPLHVKTDHNKFCKRHIRV